LVALRRPQLQPELPTAPLAQSAPPARTKGYPRWAIISGVVVYCAFCWVLVWSAGVWLLGALQASAAGH